MEDGKTAGEAEGEGEMTEYQFKLIQALRKATYPVGSNVKRFVGNMAALKLEDEMTPKQVDYLLSVGYHYRRQIPASLVPAKPKKGEFNRHKYAEELEKLRAWNAGEPK